MAVGKTTKKRAAKTASKDTTKKGSPARQAGSRSTRANLEGSGAASHDNAAEPLAAAHPHTACLLRLRAFGLRYPEAHLKSPWPGHVDLAVREKIFAHMSVEGEPLRLSCKLPRSCQTALALPFAEPTGYGLGKSGWVTATFGEEDVPPVEFLELWIDESYRAVAPKTLSKSVPPVE